MEENEWTFSDVFAQMNTFLEANMLSFVERGEVWLKYSRK